ncbi:MAG: hypothetical protein Q8K56_01025, partial [Rhodoglobus sp.]|nr:hypothetical protein [Rhodoglobus sp.]
MLLDYETLRVIWWALLGILLIGFAVLDGFDRQVAAAGTGVTAGPDARHAGVAFGVGLDAATGQGEAAASEHAVVQALADGL